MLLLVYLLLLLTPVSALNANRQDAQSALARGLSALDRGDPRTARVELMNATRADPSWPDARIAEARAALTLKDGPAAEGAITRARALGAPPGATRVMMAEALLLQGKADDALAEATSGDMPGTEGAAAARLTGDAMLALGNFGGAQAAYDRLLRTAPNDARNWMSIARFRLATGDIAAANDAAARAAELGARSPDILVFRGGMIRDQYGLAAALPWFRAALAIDKDHVPALIEMAATLGDMDRNGEMLWATRRVLALEPGNARAYYIQAVMAARGGRDQLALGLLRKTRDAFADQPATLLLTGILEVRSGNPTLGAQALNQLLVVQPNNIRARILLGRALYAARDYDGAADALEPIIARTDADTYALLLAARIAEAQGARSRVAGLLARAARPAAGSPTLFADVGGGNAAATQVAAVASMLRENNGDAALTLSARVAAENPGAPAARLLLGDSLAATGRWADAAKSYRDAADIRFGADVAMRLVAATRAAGDTPGAIAALNLFLTRNPADIGANRLAATLYLDARAWDAATRRLEWLRAAIGNDDALLMADLAWAWLGKGDKEKALAYAAHANRLSPADPAAADVYGWVMLQANGPGQDSIDLLRQAVALAPAHPLPKLHLGQAYAAMGRKGEARQMLAIAAAADFSGRNDAVKALAKL